MSSAAYDLPSSSEEVSKSAAAAKWTANAAGFATTAKIASASELARQRPEQQ